MGFRFLHRRLLIPGPILIGFNELFDRSWGDPKTPRPRKGNYPKVTPTSIGYALLPFKCIYCKSVRCDVVDPKRRGLYTDVQRGFSWCPTCRGRYVLDTNGRPLDEELPEGADHGPAAVDYGDGDGERVIGGPGNDGLDAWGAG